MKTDGCSLNLTISALACAIAKGKSEEELALLAVFFNQLGDSIATIAAGNNACRKINDTSSNNTDNINIA